MGHGGVEEARSGSQVSVSFILTYIRIARETFSDQVGSPRKVCGERSVSITRQITRNG